MLELEFEWKRVFDLYLSRELILAEKTYYKELVEKFEKELLLLPISSISKKRIKGRDYFYHQTCKIIQGRPKKYSEEHPKSGKKSQIIITYLKKDDLNVITGIKRKRFIEKSMPKLRKDLKILEQFAEKYYPYDPSEILHNLSGIYLNIPITEFNRDRNIASLEWLDLKEVSSDFFAENLKHITTSGRIVRSKSEAIIANLLDSNHISYKYEVEIDIENKKYFPDFAIFRKSDNKIIYWEHFGFICNEDYANAMLRKINDYHFAGIILWDNLIMTSDSLEGSIDAKRINNMIKTVLLT